MRILYPELNFDRSFFSIPVKFPAKSHPEKNFQKNKEKILETD